MGFPTPAFPGFASHQSTPFSLVCAATLAGSAVIIAPPTPIFTKSRRPRPEPFSGASEFFIVNSPQKLGDLFYDLVLESRSRKIMSACSPAKISIVTFRPTGNIHPTRAAFKRTGRVEQDSTRAHLLLWRRRPAGDFAMRGDHKIAGETPAPRNPAYTVEPRRFVE